MQQHNLYLQRINLVIDHIRDHLNDDLSLDKLAEVAAFSPFHFHRIFTSLTGERLNQCVGRLRLERAVALLKTSPTMPIIDAVIETGFTSASVFSRAFKARFGISPRQWDRQRPLKESKNGQVLDGFPRYSVDMLSDVDDAGEFEVRLRELPTQRLAVIHVMPAYMPENIIAGYTRLMDWFCAHGGNLARATLYGMSQDDPEVTPLELCRYDWCLTLPERWSAAPEGDSVIREFPACHVATIHCKGDIYLVDRAWQYLYRYWLPRSRFQPDNLPAMEIYHPGHHPADTGWGNFDQDCAVPIIAL
ncbi:MAG: AraC family transcriptional regulator [Burkholderiales bacterium]|nr:AraC family transcriptional regulator [Anaerolineae bacterium]